MKGMMKRGVVGLSALLFVFGAIAAAHGNGGSGGAKYVFFFLGDGMSTAQIQAAAAYKAYLAGGSENSVADMQASDNVLNMSRLPVIGLATTSSDTSFITDSAAAATAFACGIKTASGVLGRNTERTVSYKSIAQLAQEQKRAVGIVSSVSLPHATPAAYYAKANNRGSYAEIGRQGALSGFDFFGGGRFSQLDSKNTADGTTVRQALADAGYSIVTNRAEVLALANTKKVICSVATSYDNDAMPYAMDNPPENFTLAEVTRTAINCLKNNDKGFFIFVEGGRIDWAGHANDAVANIRDLLAFDEAIGVALTFYRYFPDETLIVVTGDHETGGMSLGFVGTKYKTAFDRLGAQTLSYDRFIATELKQYKASVKWVDAKTSNIDDAFKTMMKSGFGLDWNQLSAYQQELLEAAYDRSLGGVKQDARPSGYDLDGAMDVDYLAYGGYDAIAITLTHILNQEAGIAWSSTSHTALPVPVMAVGFEAARFSGFYDNTDIAKKLGQVMRTPALPVVDKTYAGALKY